MTDTALERRLNLTNDAPALPPAFAARMQVMLGDEYPAFLASYGKPLRPSLRLNPLKVSESGEGLRALLPFLGDEVPWVAGGYYYDPEGAVRPGKHPFHEAGVYYIQEASAMIPGSLCPPAPGERVLDLCAAPGGKATQLAGALMGRGLLVANEINAGRASILSQNIERMGIPNAIVTNETPAALAARFPSFFDKIVVDAPCSGEGMFRKEEQALTMWSQENVDLCAARQKEILTEAVKMLAPGGHLIYSTCTFAPEENEGTLAWLLSEYPELTVEEPRNPRLSASLAEGLVDRGNPAWVPEGLRGRLTLEMEAQIRMSIRLFPHHADGEGHFAVLLRKDGEASGRTLADGGESASRAERRNEKSFGKAGGKNAGRANDRRGGKPSGKGGADTVPGDRALKTFFAFADEVIRRRPEGNLICFGDTLYLLPSVGGVDASTVDRMRVLRAGLQLGSVKNDRFEPSHALALALSIEEDENGNTPASFALDPGSDASSAYLRGEVLPCPQGLRGWQLVTLCGTPLGWGKASDGQLKNHYPKGLRKP